MRKINKNLDFIKVYEKLKDNKCKEDEFLNSLLKGNIEWELKDYNKAFKSIERAIEIFSIDEKENCSLLIKLGILSDNFEDLLNKFYEMNLTLIKIEKLENVNFINKVFFAYYKSIYFNEGFDELALFNLANDEVEKSIFFYIVYKLSKNDEFLEISYREYKKNLSVAKLLYLKGKDVDVEILRILYKKDLSLFFKDKSSKEKIKEKELDFAFLPLGGGDEIGANSYIVIVDNCKIIVDAGMKITDEENQYPNYEKLADFIKLVDAVVITHGHLDHWGALHKLYKVNENLKFIMTYETKELIKLVSKKSDMDIKELFQLEKLLDDAKIVDFKESFTVGKEETVCELYRAGHILGAASLLIKGKKGNVFVTGDYSLERQLTVDSMDIPNCEVDILITESTYRNKNIDEVKSRVMEGERFRNYILTSINQGKKIFIPAFAIGRSQEVIKILKDIGEKENFRIYVDGMSISVSEFYDKHCDERVKGKAVHYLKNSYYDSKIDFIEEELMNNRSCLVASSGMLKEGSASGEYAKYLLSSDKVITIITGYQGRGTIGAKLLEQIKLDCEKYITIDEENIKINCKVKSFDFTAHCTIDEILALIEKLKAKKVILVHGEANLDEDFLLKILKKKKSLEIYQSKNNELIEF